MSVVFLYKSWKAYVFVKSTDLGHIGQCCWQMNSLQTVVEKVSNEFQTRSSDTPKRLDAAENGFKSF